MRRPYRVSRVLFYQCLSFDMSCYQKVRILGIHSFLSCLRYFANNKASSLIARALHRLIARKKRGLVAGDITQRSEFEIIP
jgi:hypothetical protein